VPQQSPGDLAPFFPELFLPDLSWHRGELVPSEILLFIYVYYTSHHIFVNFLFALQFLHVFIS